jgi:hypothetical protein
MSQGTRTTKITKMEANHMGQSITACLEPITAGTWSTSVEELINPAVLADVESFGRAYRSNAPTPHITIDNFLRPEVAARIAEGFPTLDQMPTIFREPMSYKGQLSDIDRHWPRFSPVFRTLQSDEFRQFIGCISGIDRLLPDPMLAGGGLHQSPRSGFLDLHVDANYHPFDKSLHRRVNIIIYVTPNWREEWGGQLEFWSDRRHKPDQLANGVVPVFNRAIIFNTTRTSWHGVSAVSCPEGIARRSLALYYYTHDRPTSEVYPDSSVIWMNKSVAWKRAIYPVMNAVIAQVKPYAKYLRRRSVFDAERQSVNDRRTAPARRND